MWQTIREISMSPNITIILSFGMAVVLIAVILSKTGLLNIHTKNVQIGAADVEREVIRQQVQWIRLHCEGLESKLERPPDYNQWRGKYIAERVFDEYVEWITFNHLSTDSAYVEIKQDKIVSLVGSLVEKEEFRTQEFEEMLKKDTKEAIGKLVQIRKVYK